MVEPLTDDRYAARPREACRWGSAAAVTIDAPITLVSSDWRHVSTSMSSTRASAPMPVEYTSASMPPSFAAASSIASWADLRR